MQHKSEILIVDDDKNLASNLQDILNAEGYGVAVAHSGKAALTSSGRTVLASPLSTSSCLTFQGQS